VSKKRHEFKRGDEVYYIGRRGAKMYCEVIDFYYNEKRNGFRYLLKGITYRHNRLEKQENKLKLR